MSRPIADVVRDLELLQSFVTFDARGHRYKVKGKPCVSVTTLLGMLDKPALKFWAASVQQEADLAAVQNWMSCGAEGDLKSVLEREKHAFQRYSRQAKDVGTQAHELIEHGLRQAMVPSEQPAPLVSGDAAYVVSGWRAWAEKYGFKPLSVETAVYSESRGVAGRFDCLGEFERHPLLTGRPVLTDWKSSKAIYEEHELQAIAYHGLFAEMMAIDPADIGSLIVRLPKETAEEPEVRVVEWDRAAFDAVMGLVPMWQWKKASSF